LIEQPFSDTESELWLKRKESTMREEQAGMKNHAELRQRIVKE